MQVIILMLIGKCHHDLRKTKTDHKMHLPHHSKAFPMPWTNGRGCGLMPWGTAASTGKQALQPAGASFWELLLLRTLFWHGLSARGMLRRLGSRHSGYVCVFTANMLFISYLLFCHVGDESPWQISTKKKELTDKGLNIVRESARTRKTGDASAMASSLEGVHMMGHDRDIGRLMDVCLGYWWGIGRKALKACVSCHLFN